MGAIKIINVGELNKKNNKLKMTLNIKINLIKKKKNLNLKRRIFQVGGMVRILDILQIYFVFNHKLKN